jgi:hypothetical protein
MVTITVIKTVPLTVTHPVFSDDEWCTVAEAARRLAVTPTAIRNRIKRKTLETKRNGNLGWLVRVPKPLSSPVVGTVPITVSPDESSTIRALEAHVQTLREQLDRQHAGHVAERDRLFTSFQEARADADDAKAAQARMAQEVSAMFQELRSLANRHAELHADRARLEAQIVTDAERRTRLEMDVAGLQSELDQERARIADLKAEGEHQAQVLDRFQAKLARSWWRRLLGR